VRRRCRGRKDFRCDGRKNWVVGSLQWMQIFGLHRLRSPCLHNNDERVFALATTKKRLYTNQHVKGGMSSHKPRRRRKSDDLSTSSRHGTTITASDGSKSPAFPLAAFLWPARGGVSQWIVLPLILMAVGLYRWCTALWPYSGISIAESGPRNVC
jgi:hypothetical protein